MIPRYSDGWSPVDHTLVSDSISDALRAVEEFAIGRDAQLVRWNDDYVAIRLDIDVDLPSRGPVDGIDIRDREPILIVLHRSEYPYRAPMARSDRVDFPREVLAHLNPVAAGQPPYLCLHRGSVEDWFAYHTMRDFLVRVRGWYRDAASGRLIREDDLFEPTRFDLVGAIAVFDAALLERAITPGLTPGWRPLLFDLLRTGDSNANINAWAVRYAFPVLPDTAEAVRALVRLRGELEDAADVPKMMLGALLWAEDERVITRFFGALPESLTDLIAFGLECGIDVEGALRNFRAGSYQLHAGIPIVLAVRRPSIVMGSNSRFEFLTFMLMAGDSVERDGGPAGLSPSAEVVPLAHRRPNSRSEARRLSGVDAIPNRIVVVGAGALGSKIVMHFGRSGEERLQVLDTDVLAPHNLVRHGLLAGALGENKAVAVAAAINALYKGENDGAAAEGRAESVLRAVGQLSSDDLLVDCTASPAVFRFLTDSEHGFTRVMRAEIASAGAIGLLSVEGSARNPRLDDLAAMTVDLSLTSPWLSAWLRAERVRQVDDRALEELEVGVGCSSNTTVASDDIISYHAAVMARGVRDAAPSEAGFVQLSTWDLRHGSGAVERVPVDPFIVVVAGNDARWTVRVSEPAARTMRELLRRHRPRETGGLLIGRIDVARRTVTVTRALEPSKDSHGTAWGFRRGIEDVPETLEDISETSGQQLLYVGEWHTHPGGGKLPSDTDLRAVAEIRTDLDRVGTPTHVMIVTPGGLFSYVYDPAA